MPKPSRHLGRSECGNEIGGGLEWVILSRLRGHAIPQNRAPYFLHGLYGGVAFLVARYRKINKILRVLLGVA